MSQFGADKFTTRSREAIEAAQLLATTAGNSTVEPIHLLVALLRDGEGTARTLVTKAGARPGAAGGPGRGGARRRCRAPPARPSSSLPPPPR